MAFCQLSGGGRRPHQEGAGLVQEHGMTRGCRGRPVGSPNMAAGPGAPALEPGGSRASSTEAASFLAWVHDEPEGGRGQRLDTGMEPPTTGAAAGSHRGTRISWGSSQAIPPGRPPCTRDCEMGTEGGWRRTPVGCECPACSAGWTFSPSWMHVLCFSWFRPARAAFP